MKNLIVDSIEILFSLGMFVNAALFVPQFFTLIKTKNAKSLSLLTFAGFNCLQLITILHAWVVKDYLLLIGIFISLITCGAVTCAILMYRNR
jgi:MtN3 and saliva related transmembrane protein